MPTYIQKTTNSDITPSGNKFAKEMSAGTGTDTGVLVDLTSSQVISGFFFTPSGKPNSDSWENGGTWTVEIEVDSVSPKIDARVRVQRYNSSGTLQESGNFTASQTLNGTVSFSPVAPTWSTQACGDRIGIEIEFTETQGKANSVTIGLGTTANEVVTDITEDAGTCGGTPSGPPADSAMMMGCGI
jgi:hypothetical protein